jgi:citrate lyase subunit beta / citryl-CoA lyase
MLPLRSLLFVPSNRERFLAKLDSLRPDAVILDLEDSIPPVEKSAARTALGELLRSERFANHRLFVRINDFRTGLTAADIAAVVSARLAGIFLPKVEHVAEIREANHLLALAEARVGLEVGSTRLIPIVETVRGIVRVAELADSGPRILALCFGYDDFTGDLGVRRTQDGLETLYPRAQLAITARAMDVLAIDGPLADFNELAALAEESRVSRQLGFTGKQCIHPSQIDTINAAFTPTSEEIARARAELAAWEAAAAAGYGSTRLGDSMIDAPVVRRARQLLAQVGELRDP